MALYNPAPSTHTGSSWGSVHSPSSAPSAPYVDYAPLPKSPSMVSPGPSSAVSAPVLHPWLRPSSQPCFPINLQRACRTSTSHVSECQIVQPRQSSSQRLTMNDPAFDPCNLSKVNITIRAPDGYTIATIVVVPARSIITVEDVTTAVVEMLQTCANGATFYGLTRHLQRITSAAFEARTAGYDTASRNMGFKFVDMLGENIIFAGFKLRSNGLELYTIPSTRRY